MGLGAVAPPPGGGPADHGDLGLGACAHTGRCRCLLSRLRHCTRAQHPVAGEVRDLPGAAHHRPVRQALGLPHGSVADAAGAADAAAIKPAVRRAAGRDGRPRHSGAATADSAADLSAVRACPPVCEPLQPDGGGAAGGQPHSGHCHRSVCGELIDSPCGTAGTCGRLPGSLLLGVLRRQSGRCGHGGGARLACLPGDASRGVRQSDLA